MTPRQQLFSLQPFTPPDFAWNPNESLPIPADVIQLQVDTVNVLEGRVDISTFTPGYQQKIKDYWRFSAMRQSVKEQNMAKRTTDTLDAV